LDVLSLQAVDTEAHFHVVTNATDPEFFRPTGNQSQPATAIFAAAFDWYPNLSGAEHLLKDIWPLIRAAVPEGKLLLAGKRPPKSLYRATELDSRVDVIADVEDIRPLIQQSEVVVCPVTEGGGTRLKILDALAMGKAVVSTARGCEGLNVQAGRHLLVANSAQEFAQFVLKLWSDSSLRARLGHAGRVLIEEQYNWRVAAQQLRNAYRCALSGCHSDPSGAKTGIF
jgi:glycosyltransferase involved in cell wall biosynthesis